MTPIDRITEMMYRTCSIRNTVSQSEQDNIGENTCGFIILDITFFKILYNWSFFVECQVKRMLFLSIKTAIKNLLHILYVMDGSLIVKQNAIFMYFL